MPQYRLWIKISLNTHVCIGHLTQLTNKLSLEYITLHKWIPERRILKVWCKCRSSWCRPCSRAALAKAEEYIHVRVFTWHARSFGNRCVQWRTSSLHNWGRFSHSCYTDEYFGAGEGGRLVSEMKRGEGEAKKKCRNRQGRGKTGWDANRRMREERGERFRGT